MTKPNAFEDIPDEYFDDFDGRPPGNGYGPKHHERPDHIEKALAEAAAKAEAEKKENDRAPVYQRRRMPP